MSENDATPGFVMRAYDEALGVSLARDLAPVDGERARGFLPSTLDVAQLAAGSVASLAAAVDRLFVASGFVPRSWRFDADRIAAAYSSDRLFRVDGEPVSAFAELSGFFETADGWVRTHANYPHHRERMCEALSLPSTVSRASFTAALGALSALS